MVAVVDGQRRDGRMGHRVPVPRVEPDRRAGGAVQQVGHELALVGHPVEVGARRCTGPDVPECGAAVQLLASGGQVDTRQRIIDRLGRAGGDAAEGVDQDRETTEAHLGVVVDPQPGGLFDRLSQQGGAAERERRVDLVGAVAGYRHIRITRDGDHRGGRARPHPRQVYQQDRVGAAVADVAAGGQLGLLLGGERFAAVGPDQEPGGAVSRCGPLVVLDERGDPMQRVVDPESGADDCQDGHQQQGEQDSDPGQPPALLAGGGGFLAGCAGRRYRGACRRLLGRRRRRPAALSRRRRGRSQGPWWRRRGRSPLRRRRLDRAPQHRCRLGRGCRWRRPPRAGVIPGKAPVVVHQDNLRAAGLLGRQPNQPRWSLSSA